MFSDRHSLETTCPRYWKSVIQRAEFTDIDVTWTDANELRVEMDGESTPVESGVPVVPLRDKKRRHGSRKPRPQRSEGTARAE